MLHTIFAGVVFTAMVLAPCAIAYLSGEPAEMP